MKNGLTFIRGQQSYLYDYPIEHDVSGYFDRHVIELEEQNFKDHDKIKS